MKRIFLLIVLVLLVFAYVNRQRLYLRDPMGSVARNGVKEDGAMVFINQTNDVLIENDNAPMYVTLVQRDRPVGLPAELKCMHWLICMTDADNATLLATDAKAKIVTMTSKAVSFRDEQGRNTVVTLH